MTTIIVHRASGNQTCMTTLSPRNPQTAVLRLESATHQDATARGLRVHEFWDADALGNVNRTFTLYDQFARTVETVTLTLLEGGKPC